MHSKKWFSKNMNFFFGLIVTLILFSTGIGILLSNQSINNIKNVLWNHMESVSSLASSLINGDEVKLLTEDDAPILDDVSGKRIEDGSIRYSNIEKVLLEVKTAQNSMNIPYIYIVRYEGDELVFIVDTDLINPAEYGEKIVYTPAQDVAWKSGKTVVDDEPYEDEWGKYYTAWSPIFDSTDHVVGLVGVDFEAVEVKKQTNYSIVMIITSTSIFLIISIALFSIYSINTRKKMRQLGNEVNNLADNLTNLFDEIEGVKSSDEKENIDVDDFISYIKKKTIDMTKRLHQHTEYMENLAKIDYMTKVGNVRAFSELKEALQDEIDKGTANFGVIFVDINDLKSTNDKYGHEVGDNLIKCTAISLKKAFKNDEIFRIGGDEFVIIIKDATDKGIRLLLDIFDYECAQLGSQIENIQDFTVSKGYAIFDPYLDKDFKSVLAKADQNMYLEKEIYHSKDKFK